MTTKCDALPAVPLHRFVLPPHIVRKGVTAFGTGKCNSEGIVWEVWTTGKEVRRIGEGETIKEARQNARKAIFNLQNTEISRREAEEDGK